MKLTKDLKIKLEKLAKILVQSKKEQITDQAEEFTTLTKDLSPEELAMFCIVYGGLKWEQGYEQGTNDPDFENCEEDEEENAS